VIWALSKSEIDSFNEYGFLLKKQVFSHFEIEDLSRRFETLRQKGLKFESTTDIEGARYVIENKILQRIVWCGGADSKLLKTGEDLRILEPVSQLLKSQEMLQLISQAHIKMPGDGVRFEWHQDSQHRGYGTSDWVDLNNEGSYIQTLIPIDEVYPNSGSLMVYPKSHQKGHLRLDVAGRFESEFNEFEAIRVPLEPGDLLLFGPYLVHGSFENRSKFPRRVFINGYAYPGANKRIYPGAGSGRMLSVRRLENQTTV